MGSWGRTGAGAGAQLTLPVAGEGRLLVVGLSGRLSAEGAGALLGGIVLLPGLVVGLVARRSGSRWAWWRYLLMVLLVAVVLSAIRRIPSQAEATA